MYLSGDVISCHNGVHLGIIITCEIIHFPLFYTPYYTGTGNNQHCAPFTSIINTTLLCFQMGKKKKDEGEQNSTTTYVENDHAHSCQNLRKKEPYYQQTIS